VKDWVTIGVLSGDVTEQPDNRTRRQIKLGTRTLRTLFEAMAKRFMYDNTCFAGKQ
jgi:hypothetical protein